jgi:calcineurin-like phosphoesterase family protein
MSRLHSVDLSRVWLLTDPHFFHYNLVRRGNRPDGYEERLRSHWTSNVLADDVVLCLGDVCMAKQAEAHRLYVQATPGYKILVRGNHDNEKDDWYLRRGWDEVHRTLALAVDSTRVLFSHFPQADEGQYDLNVHGHFHNDQHRADEPEMVAIRSPRQRLLALECVNYELVSMLDFVEGRVVQDGLPVL